MIDLDPPDPWRIASPEPGGPIAVAVELRCPRVYDCESHGYTRETLHNTEWLTTIGARDGRIAWLRHHFPEQYRALVREFPRVQRLS